MLRTVLVACALTLGCQKAAVEEPVGEVAVTRAAIVQDALVVAARDTYVRELAPWTTSGSETSVRVQGLDRQRVIVQFDQTALVAAAAGRPVTEASLELTVQDMSWVYGQISAHRMKSASTEAGATWACANDTTPGNATNNCTAANGWQMNALLPASLPYVATATNTQNVSIGATVVKFNVTSDVQAFLAGTQPNNGWLLKVVIDAVPGTVRFRSRESAQAPRLVLDLGNAPCVPTAATDTTCNNVDDDCSGQRDEDFVSAATSCGVGACARTGATSCTAGVLTNSCTAGAPAASDATCNNVDDDCSGQSDEDYVSVATSCGVGVCSRTGSTSCAVGAIVNSCTAGAPTAPNDATCNGADEDCSGVADEDFVAAATSCGVGACARTGVASCSAGVIANSCAAGAPAASDATCNGIDEDCNGAADEDFVSTPTSCGSGACVAAGSTFCSAATVQNSCTPVASCEGDCGNGSDDDNDADVDCADSDCDAAGACEGSVGDQCEIDADCQGVPDAHCFTEQESGVNGGFCSAFCDDVFDNCPSGSECMSGRCFVPCSDEGTCDAGQECFEIETPSNGACVPVCSDDSECHDGNICYESGGCLPPPSSETACNDTLDDDRDGDVDCADSDCATAQDCVGSSNIGGTCTVDADCGTHPSVRCDTGFPGGYCFVPCDTGNPLGECPADSACWLGSACIVPCLADNTCENPAFVCDGLDALGLPPDPFCRPTCAVSCPSGTTCDPDSQLCF